jgi:hypothetical protein
MKKGKGVGKMVFKKSYPYQNILKISTPVELYQFF